ncbi:ABC transporter substrate-binding protein [soil metagenome]
MEMRSTISGDGQVRIRAIAVMLFVSAFAALTAPQAQAQPLEAPRIPFAEQAFIGGLTAFEARDFPRALNRFVSAATEFEFNQRTTAAYLMAARTHFALGNIAEARQYARHVIENYPSSRYAGPARELTARMDGTARPTVVPLRLGVLLPLDAPSQRTSQALFNGILFAVDEHNETAGARPVVLVFRDSGGQTEAARRGVEQLSREGVHIIIGPLYSDEAGAAGEVAERVRIPMVTPLATESAVSAGRHFVFQANPTFSMRGRVMARYAAENLNVRTFGTLAERGSFGESMAIAFIEEATRLGLRSGLDARLPTLEAWGDLDFFLPANEVSQLDAIYVPVTGRGAPEAAAATLRGLQASGQRLRVLGNLEWEALETSCQLASEFGVTHTQDFHVDLSLSVGFDRRFYETTGELPERPAYIGYDLTRMLLGAVATARTPNNLAESIRSADRFHGLAHRLHFRGNQVNEWMFIMGYRDGEDQLID